MAYATKNYTIYKHFIVVEEGQNSHLPIHPLLQKIPQLPPQLLNSHYLRFRIN